MSDFLEDFVIENERRAKDAECRQRSGQPLTKTDAENIVVNAFLHKIAPYFYEDEQKAAADAAV